MVLTELPPEEDESMPDAVVDERPEERPDSSSPEPNSSRVVHVPIDHPDGRSRSRPKPETEEAVNAPAAEILSSVKKSGKVEPKYVRTIADSKPGLPEKKKKKNVREISIFEFLAEKQNELDERDDPHHHGRFEVLRHDVGEGVVVLGFTRNSLRLNIRF